MKKLFSLILAMALTLSMSTAVFAEEVVPEKWDGKYTATTATEFNEIVKTYTSENSVVVNETLSFTSTASTSNPDKGTANLTVADLAVSSLNPGTLTVTIPSLSVAGTYEWTIKENAGSTAGVTYSTDEVHVIVLVEYDNNTHALKIANKSSYIKTENGEKAKTFNNTFNSGSFTVAKDVDGNMANENDEFEISVTLTSAQPIGTNVTLAGTAVTPSQWSEVKGDDGVVTGYTYTSTLNYSEAAGAKTFSDIPVGVTVTVNETETDMKGYTYDSTTIEGDKFTSLTVENTTNAAIVVKNTKSTTITTGINMDSVPYILLLAVVCVGLVGFVVKRRTSRY